MRSYLTPAISVVAGTMMAVLYDEPALEVAIAGGEDGVVAHETSNTAATTRLMWLRRGVVECI